MIANLFGFCFEPRRHRGAPSRVVWHRPGRQPFLVASATLFVGVQVMFELREAEKRGALMSSADL